MWNVLLKGSNGHNFISNFDSACLSISFTPCISHTALKSISSSTTQHFIDSQHVPWMNSNSHVVVIFCATFVHVFITGNTCGFKCFGSQLFSFMKQGVQQLAIDRIWLFCYQRRRFLI